MFLQKPLLTHLIGQAEKHQWDFQITPKPTEPATSVAKWKSESKIKSCWNKDFPLKFYRKFNQTKRSAFISELTLTWDDGFFKPDIELYSLLEKTLPIGRTLAAKANWPNKDCISFKLTFFILMNFNNTWHNLYTLSAGRLNSISIVFKPIPRNSMLVVGKTVFSSANGMPKKITDQTERLK